MIIDITIIFMINSEVKMDNKQFETIVDNQLTICKNVLCNKSKEYDFLYYSQIKWREAIV